MKWSSSDCKPTTTDHKPPTYRDTMYDSKGTWLGINSWVVNNITLCYQYLLIMERKINNEYSDH